jgi:hypothetical protein
VLQSLLVAGALVLVPPDSSVARDLELRGPLRRAALAPAQAVAPADKPFWVALKESGFTPPAGSDPAAILAAVEPLLDSPDPVLRDEVAYGLTVAWIYRDRRVPDDAIRAFARRLRDGLHVAGGGDAVLRRSFSALLLSIVAAADVRSPILADAERRALVADAAAFLVREPDTRGYDARLGWVHATAHTADLLKFLARSPRLTPADERTVLDAVLARIDREGPVFAWGEDERLAAVLVSLARRPAFDAAPLDRWMEALPRAWQALWATPALDSAAFARLANAKHVLHSLHLALSGGGGTAATAALADRVRSTLDRFE